MSLQAVLIICLVTVCSALFGLLGLWQPFVIGILFLILLFCSLLIKVQVFKSLFSQNKFHYFHVLLLVLFIFTIIFYLISVLLPETGFDALWYHLPLIQEYVQHHRLVYDPAYYQSLYPQYGDGVLLLGFGLFGVVGAKFIAFLFFSLLSSATYFWLKEKLSVVDALIGTLVVCFFQVASWQSSSAYVDVISAVFFLWLARYLIHSEKQRSLNLHFFVASLSTGIFLGTKFVNLGFIPLLVILSAYSFFNTEQSIQQKIKQFTLFWLITAVTSLPWYFRAWWFTGSIIYPIGTMYAVPVIAQMGVSGWHEWFNLRIRELLRLPFDFFFRNDGYVTPLLLLFFPIVLVKKHFTKEFLLGVVIGVYGLLFWFFFPPPSTRYVLGPIIVLWLVIFQKLVQTFERTKWIYLIRLLCIASIVFFLGMRVFVSTRAIPYLMGWESQQQYLDRFRNGFTDEKINTFYGNKE